MPVSSVIEEHAPTASDRSPDGGELSLDRLVVWIRQRSDVESLSIQRLPHRVKVSLGPGQVGPMVVIPHSDHEGDALSGVGRRPIRMQRRTEVLHRSSRGLTVDPCSAEVFFGPSGVTTACGGAR